MADLVTSVGGKGVRSPRPLATGVTAEAQTFHSAPHHVEPSVPLQTLSLTVYSTGERNEGVAGHRQCCLLKPCQAHSGVGKSAWGRATPSPKTSHSSATAWLCITPEPPRPKEPGRFPATLELVWRFSEVNKQMQCLYMM